MVSKPALGPSKKHFGQKNFFGLKQFLGQKMKKKFLIFWSKKYIFFLGFLKKKFFLIFEIFFLNFARARMRAYRHVHARVPKVLKFPGSSFLNTKTFRIERVSPISNKMQVLCR